jgi:hypothetical protein
MPMNKKLIAEVSKILMSWNPLGPKAKSIPDLDNYHTESIDILFAIEVAPSSDSIDRIVQDVLNQAFDLSLDLKTCSEPAQKITAVLNKYAH